MLCFICSRSSISKLDSLYPVLYHKRILEFWSLPAREVDLVSRSVGVLAYVSKALRHLISPRGAIVPAIWAPLHGAMAPLPHSVGGMAASLWRHFKASAVRLVTSPVLTIYGAHPSIYLSSQPAIQSASHSANQPSIQASRQPSNSHPSIHSTSQQPSIDDRYSQPASHPTI